MELEVKFRIILETPPAGVDFGLQKGAGSDYETIQTQRSKGKDLRFGFTARVKEARDGSPNFLGPFIQGPHNQRFAYIDIGTYAGQKDTPWSRRLKVPIREIAWDTLNCVTAGKLLETHVRGTAPDGSPTCATVKPFAGWKIVSV